MADYKIPFAEAPVPEYESPYQLKYAPAYTAKLVKRADAESMHPFDRQYGFDMEYKYVQDDHSLWTLCREEYATTGDEKHLIRMLDHVTETCPPDAPKREVPAPPDKPVKQARMPAIWRNEGTGIRILLVIFALVVAFMVFALCMAIITSV